MKTFVLPKLNSGQDLIDFIYNDMDACLKRETVDEIKAMSRETLERLESLTVGERHDGILARQLTFNYKAK